MKILKFLIAISAITAFAQGDGEWMIATNSVGWCDAEALVTRVEGDSYAIVFEGEECLKLNNKWTTATINGETIGAQVVRRTAVASIYYLEKPNDFKDELCATGEIQGITVNTPLGIMTAANRTETFIRNNGCVVAMKASEGLYINATELRMFASPMLQAFYRLDTRCGATNVCGVGLVTAAHCVLGENKSDTIKLWDRVGDSTLIFRRQAIAIKAEPIDYAIFPQQKGHCIPPIAGNLRQGEMIYIPTFGKAGPKMVTSEYKYIDSDGDMAIERATISKGDSGTGAINRRGEFAGVMINTTKTLAHIRGMEQIRNVSDLTKVK